jgi:hypothetical protein
MSNNDELDWFRRVKGHGRNIVIFGTRPVRLCVLSTSLFAHNISKVSGHYVNLSFHVQVQILAIFFDEVLFRWLWHFLPSQLVEDRTGQNVSILRSWWQIFVHKVHHFVKEQ